MAFHPKALLGIALCCQLASRSSAQETPARPGGQALGRPPTVTFVFPETNEWFPYTPDASAVAITSANPRAGRGPSS